MPDAPPDPGGGPVGTVAGADGLFSGTWYVTPTTFGPDGALDLASQRSLTEAVLEWGADGLTVLGAMGEVDAATSVFGGLGGAASYFELRRGAVGTMTGFSYPEVLRQIRISLRAGAAPSGELLAELDEVLEALQVHPASVPLIP